VHRSGLLRFLEIPKSIVSFFKIDSRSLQLDVYIHRKYRDAGKLMFFTTPTNMN